MTTETVGSPRPFFSGPTSGYDKRTGLVDLPVIAGILPPFRLNPS